MYARLYNAHICANEERRKRKKSARANERTIAKERDEGQQWGMDASVDALSFDFFPLPLLLGKKRRRIIDRPSVCLSRDSSGWTIDKISNRYCSSWKLFVNVSFVLPWDSLHSNQFEQKGNEGLWNSPIDKLGRFFLSRSTTIKQSSTNRKI